MRLRKEQSFLVSQRLLGDVLGPHCRSREVFSLLVRDEGTGRDCEAYVRVPSVLPIWLWRLARGNWGL